VQRERIRDKDNSIKRSEQEKEERRALDTLNYTEHGRGKRNRRKNEK
jgi:hypothetical protein